ncbi:hypothetical protein BC567DRAFT_213276 [Phyllosticta citribraziliensis]
MRKKKSPSKRGKKAHKKEKGADAAVAAASSSQDGGKALDPSVPSRDSFPLLSLPRELRDEIYDHRFVFGVIRIQSGRCDKSCYQKGTMPDESGPPNCHFSLSASEELECADAELICKERSTSPPVALFRACRRMRGEAAPVLYAKNMFFFDQCCHECQAAPFFSSAIPGAVVFLKKLGQDTLKWIKKVKIMLGVDSFNVLREAVSRPEIQKFWSLINRKLSLDQLAIIHRGKSYLTPVKRPSPLLDFRWQARSLVEYFATGGVEIPYLRPPTYEEFRRDKLKVMYHYGILLTLYEPRIFEDYKDDDDGENDSLHEVDVSRESLDMSSLPKVRRRKKEDGDDDAEIESEDKEEGEDSDKESQID